MSRTIEYLAVVALGLALFAFVIQPAVSATVQAMNDHANLIAGVR